jgi:V/A-type H+-transporting ATPase subunit D
VATKIKTTRPELKRQRDALKRYRRYLPMLKLKQQQLQMMMRDVSREYRRVQSELASAEQVFEAYRSVTAGVAGVDVRALSKPARVDTGVTNVAGVALPVFRSVEFPPLSYSLFSTAAWVDRTLADLRRVSALKAEGDVLTQQYQLLERELTRVIQRVNLFEKVKIPESQNAIRVIRIRLGDEMTAGVGRAKIAKSKLSGAEEGSYASAPTLSESGVTESGAMCDDEGEQ